MPLYDIREDIPETQRVRRGPEIHFVEGLVRHLPWLTERAVVCLSDWQFDVPAQQHFWKQTLEHLRDELGPAQFSRGIFLIAGDMASSDNTLRGVASDAVPDFSWLIEDLGDENEVYIVYGNHDVASAEHLDMKNRVGTRCILPQGAITVAGVAGKTDNDELEKPVLKEKARSVESTKDSCDSDNIQDRPPPGNSVADEVLSKAERAAYYQQMKAQGKLEAKAPTLTKLQRQEKQWHDQNPQEAEIVERFLRRTVLSAQTGGDATSTTGDGRRELRIGCVHGIPSSHSQGLKKMERGAFLRSLSSICGEVMSDEAQGKMDILMTHSNPCLPGQENVVRGDDAKEVFRLFMKSPARLHVHGHQHTPEVVSVVDEGKVVVNADCRVVVLLSPRDMDW